MTFESFVQEMYDRVQSQSVPSFFASVYTGNQDWSLRNKEQYKFLKENDFPIYAIYIQEMKGTKETYYIQDKLYKSHEIKNDTLTVECLEKTHTIKL